MFKITVSQHSDHGFPCIETLVEYADQSIGENTIEFSVLVDARNVTSDNKCASLKSAGPYAMGTRDMISAAYGEDAAAKFFSMWEAIVG